MEQRRILFKAKRLCDNVWVKGDLLHKGNKTYIHCPHINDRGFWVENVEVDNSTVCQFTGLKDKEGKEVWEHDLLTKDGSIIYEVGYEGCGFKASIQGENEFIYNLVAVCKYNCVCGNKFDRKEGEK